MAEPFSYAVVRLVPDIERGERVNVGVIVFCRPLDFLGARTGPRRRPCTGDRARLRSRRGAAAPRRDRAHRVRRPGRRPDRRARHHRPIPLAGGTVEHHHPAVRGAHRALRRPAGSSRRALRAAGALMLDPSIPVPAVGRSFPAQAQDPPGGHGRARASAAGRGCSVSPGHRDRRRAGDGVGGAGPPVVRPAHPRRGSLAVRRRPRGRARDVVQRARRHRRGPALVAPRGQGREHRGRQRLDPPRARPAAGADRVVRRLRGGDGGRSGLDAARAVRRRPGTHHVRPGRCGRPTSTCMVT